MAEKTLGDLIAELDTLDVVAAHKRFNEIVAEIANHAAELPGGLAGLARSLVWQRRCAVAAALRRARVAERDALLTALLGDAHPQVRTAAVHTAHLGFPSAAQDAVIACVAEAEVATAAIAALGKHGDGRTLPALLGAAAHDNPHVRTAALTALAALAGRLGESGFDDALADAPEPAWRALLPKLTDKTPIEKTVKEAVERRAAITADPADLEDFGRVVRVEDAGPAFEREALVDDLVARIGKPGGRSFILVGEPGVGKSHIVKALAARLAAGRPRWTVLETSSSEVMVGTKYIGEWETRLGELIKRARAPRRVLLFFTNVTELAGAGTTSKNDASFLSMLGPYLKRGDVTIVGEASAAAVQRGLERAGQKGFFQLITVPELAGDAVPRLLGRQIAETARRAGVELVVPREVQDLVVTLAGTYYSSLAEPGRSLKLLGEVLARRLEERADRSLPLEIGAEDVITSLARISGLPEALLNDKQPLDAAAVRGFFEERILGQREAVDAMVDLITLVKAGLNDPGKPLGVLFFVGPTGVGKTEIAKALAELIYGSAERMIRLDLSEYKDYDSYEKLIGGRGARDAGGSLSGRVRERPFSVILLDEIEKAHPNVFDLLLSLFDDGRLTDAHGERADFRQAIVVMTSNLGSAAESGGLGFGAGEGGVPGEERVRKEIRRFFRPEFVNRLGKIVVFKPLSGETMRTLVRRELGKVLLRSGILRRGLRVDVAPAVVDLLLEEGFSIEYGARPLKRRVEQAVLLPLARAIVGLAPEERGVLLKVLVDDGKVVVRRRGTRPAAAAVEGERLKLRRPEDERLQSVKAADLAGVVAALADRLDQLVARAGEPRLAARKSEIVAATAAPSFWDDATRAKALLAEMVHLEELVESLARARRRVEDLGGFARSVARHAHLRARFEKAHGEVVDELVALEFRLFGEQPEDRRDAFVAVRRIGADRDAAEAAELVTRMYTSWAERRGVALTWLARGDDGDDCLALLEGRSLYGLLRGEEGLHCLDGGGKGAERREAFARVEVSARPDDEAGLPRREVRIERGKDEVLAVHGPSGTSVAATAETSDELALELLAAEVAARARRKRGGDDRVVRRYGIEGRYAVDEDTAIRVPHKELLAGGLDELLRARLYGGRA